MIASKDLIKRGKFSKKNDWRFPFGLCILERNEPGAPLVMNPSINLSFVTFDLTRDHFCLLTRICACSGWRTGSITQ